jgi:hypothetical protein
VSRSALDSIGGGTSDDSGNKNERKSQDSGLTGSQEDELMRLGMNDDSLAVSGTTPFAEIAENLIDTDEQVTEDLFQLSKEDSDKNKLL